MRLLYCKLRVSRVVYGVGSAIATFSLPLTAVPGLAQLNPDASLGVESSVVTPDGSTSGVPTTLIEGGATRGSNLFHSFQDFNVNTGQAVYFANPTEIQNILTRVTGGNLSNIDGLLGVNGAANLFLLNPNGVVFGPNARLDISGSFLTSTGSSFTFADGSVFSAVPSGNELLTVSVPLGVQDGANPGDITSTGRLQTGQDLTLLGNNLNLQGQLLAGGDLTLDALDTVMIRDAATEPFVANAGGALTIQGDRLVDISALQPFGEPSLVSGGPLTIYSDGEIYIDSQFESGGSLQFLTLAGIPGNVRSRDSSVMVANGNVVFGSYEGVALLVEATGSIQAENIWITTPNTIFTPDGSGSDADRLASDRTVVLRAGADTVRATHTPQLPGNSSPEVVPDLSLLFPNIFFFPTGSIIANGAILTSDGGGGPGGAIVLSAAGDIFVTELNSASGASGNQASTSGGSISAVAGGNIVVGSLSSASFSEFGNSGSGGSISFNAGDYIYASGVNTDSVSNSGDAGPGGDISFLAGSDIFSDYFVSASIARQGNADNGGSVSLSAAGEIVPGPVYSLSLAGLSSGNGGDIEIRGETIRFYVLNSSSGSERDNSGDGGSVFLSGSEISGYGISTSAVAVTPGKTSGSGGDITFDSRRHSSGFIGLENNIFELDLDLSTLSSTGKSGNLSIQGMGDILIQNVDLIASGQIQVSFPKGFSGAEIITEPFLLEASNFGQSGNVVITSPGSLTLENVRLLSDANGQLPAGSITLQTPNQIQLINTEINTNTNSTGAAGSISVTAGQGLTLQSGSQIVAGTNSQGRGGNITLYTPRIDFIDGGQIAASTAGQGTGGSLTVFSNGPLILQGNGQLTVGALLANSGRAGDLNVNASTLALRDGVELSVNSASQAGGGNINIAVDGTMVMVGGSYINATSSNPNAGDGGNIAIRLGNGFLIAGSEQNNDIIANAVGGNGGNINISALRLFGFSLQDEPNVAFLRGNGTNDISASSEVGLPGAIALDTLAIDPSQGLVELPVDLSDRANQITPGCGLGSTSDQGEFVVTGRGGLPPNPSDPIAAAGVNVPWVVADRDLPTAETIRPRSTDAGSSLVEAQGIDIDAAGHAYFVAEASHGNVVNQGAIAPPLCAISTHL